MNVTELLKRTEQLQGLLDRRARILQDLQHVDEDIEDVYAELMGAEAPKKNGKPKQKALPPAGARQTGTARRALPKSKTKKKTNGETERRFGPGEAKGAVLSLLAASPKKQFTTNIVRDLMKCTRVQAANALNHAQASGAIKKTAPGVYQHKRR